MRAWRTTSASTFTGALREPGDYAGPDLLASGTGATSIFNNVAKLVATPRIASWDLRIRGTWDGCGRILPPTPLCDFVSWRSSPPAAAGAARH